jgi:hypothetical protein
MKEPRVYEIKNGWAAAGDGWAVHAATREEALRQFEEARREHDEIKRRPPYYEQPRVFSAQL